MYGNRWLDVLDLWRGRLLLVVHNTAKPQRDVDKSNEDRNLDERANHGGKRLTRRDAKDADSNGDRELEVIAGRRK